MGSTMGTGNVHHDDVETLQFADESSDYEDNDRADEVDEAREYFAQNVLDYDRNPTEADFVRWLVNQRLTLMGKVRRVEALADQYARDGYANARKRDVVDSIRTLLTD